MSAKAKSPILVQANITCLCVTLGYSESSHLVSAREVGDRISKDITVYPITQEWERSIAFFSVVFGDYNLEVPTAPGGALRFGTVMTTPEPPRPRKLAPSWVPNA